MNWKFLLPLPLAALVVASPLKVPKLRPPIPLLENMPCAYPWALRQYLDAYAYAQENPTLSFRLLQAAEKELGSCGESAGLLRNRVRELKGAWKN